MRVVFDHKHSEAQHIVTFYFRPETKLSYIAGQYIELTLMHENPDNYGIKRKFTLSSSPGEELISITSKFTNMDSSSFKKAMLKLKRGDELTISQPMGEFVLPADTSRPLIFIAGGIGITPFYSMAKWMSKTGEKRSIKLLYGVNNEDEIVFDKELSKVVKQSIVSISEPSAQWKGQKGYVTADLIIGLEHPTSDSLLYISGPEVMVENLQAALLDRGIKKQQLVLDAFLGYRAA